MLTYAALYTQDIFSELRDVTDHLLKAHLLSHSSFMSDDRLLKALQQTRKDFYEKDRTGTALESMCKDILGYRTGINRAFIEP